MDRIDAMKVFVSAVDEGSLAGAGRRLRRSPAAVSRAIAFLENHVGAELLHRTTRSLKLSEAGERYVAACRRVLTELEEADLVAGSERSAPRGTLSLTAPIVTGEDILRSILEAFLNEYQAVTARLILIDRQVNLIDEGFDVALRIAHLADSNFIAIRVGEVRRVVAASPGYLAQHPVIREPADLAKHPIVAMTHFGLDSWSFPPLKGSSVPRTVQFAPRLVVNTVRAADGRARRHPAVFLSHRRRNPGRTAATPAQQGRTPAAAGSSAGPAGASVRAQGAGLCRFRHAASQAVFHPAFERSRQERQCHSFARRKSAFRIASIRRKTWKA
jgi:DNA-binding transcriptional LysR family regulator